MVVARLVGQWPTPTVVASTANLLSTATHLFINGTFAFEGFGTSDTDVVVYLTTAGGAVIDNAVIPSTLAPKGFSLSVIGLTDAAAGSLTAAVYIKGMAATAAVVATIVAAVVAAVVVAAVVVAAAVVAAVVVAAVVAAVVVVVSKSVTQWQNKKLLLVGASKLLLLLLKIVRDGGCCCCCCC